MRMRVRVRVRVRVRKKRLTVIQVGVSPYVRMCVRVRVRREILRTAIAPCSDSVRKIQFCAHIQIPK